MFQNLLKWCTDVSVPFPMYIGAYDVSSNKFLVANTKVTQNKHCIAFDGCTTYMNNYKVVWNVFFLYDEKQRPIFNWTFFSIMILAMMFDERNENWCNFISLFVCCYESVSIIIVSVSDAFVRCK